MRKTGCCFCRGAPIWSPAKRCAVPHHPSLRKMRKIDCVFEKVPRMLIRKPPKNCKICSAFFSGGLALHVLAQESCRRFGKLGFYFGRMNIFIHYKQNRAYGITLGYYREYYSGTVFVVAIGN